MATYFVIHYGHILPCYDVVKDGMSLEEAEALAEKLQKEHHCKHKFPYNRCCRWFVQKEE